MTESYEPPVLFTDDECKAYAAWGMKKEKVLMPFALITILIYMVATVLVVMKVWGVRESDHLLFQMLLWGDWIPELETFLNPADNTICYQKKWYRIGENTIENIYPPEKKHPWMDHPENKASGIIDVQRLMEILKGYEASLKAARKECEWMEKHGG